MNPLFLSSNGLYEGNNTPLRFSLTFRPSMHFSYQHSRLGYFHSLLSSLHCPIFSQLRYLRYFPPRIPILAKSISCGQIDVLASYYQSYRTVTTTRDAFTHTILWRHRYRSNSYWLLLCGPQEQFTHTSTMADTTTIYSTHLVSSYPPTKIETDLGPHSFDSVPVSPEVSLVSRHKINGCQKTMAELGNCPRSCNNIKIKMPISLHKGRSITWDAREVDFVHISPKGRHRIY